MRPLLLGRQGETLGGGSGRDSLVALRLGDAGLAAGAGFYEGALMMCVLIYVVLVSLNKLDSTHVKASRVMNVYVELKSGVPLSALLRAVKSMGIQVNDIQDIGSRSAETHGYILELEIMRPELGHVEAAEQVAKIEQVEFCEEMKA